VLERIIDDSGYRSIQLLMSTNETMNLSPFGPQIPSMLTQLIQGTELLSYII